MTDEEVHKSRVIDEIIDTEESYLYYLTQAVQVALPLFKEQAEVKNYGITQEKVTRIFANIEILFEFHKTFLTELKSRDIARVFLQFSDYLKLYTVFINMYEDSDDTLQEIMKKGKNRPFLRFLTKVRNQMGMDLTSILIMPIQRIPRYKLLLSELRKYTPRKHPSRLAIEECVVKIEKVAQFVNEAKARLEKMDKLKVIADQITGSFQVISPHRVFIRDDILILLTSTYFRNKKTHRFLLFNDIILWTAKNGKYKGVRHLEGVATAAVKDNPELYVLTHETEEPVKIQCRSEANRQSWTNAINRARDELAGINARRLLAMEEREKNVFLDLAPTRMSREGSQFSQVDDEDGAPMRASEMRKLINDAFRDQTIETATKVVTTLEQNESIHESMTPIKDHMNEIKTLLQTDTQNDDDMSMLDVDLLDTTISNFLVDPIENANYQASWIANKVSISLDKFKRFSVSKNPTANRNSARSVSLQRKFEADKDILSESLSSVKSRKLHRRTSAVNLDSTPMGDIKYRNWKDFWMDNFGRNTIIAFEDMKTQYEKDYEVELIDEICDELLFHFAFPPNTKYAPQKEFPIAIRDFEIVANVLKFPFDLSELRRDARGALNVGIVEAAKKEELAKLISSGTASQLRLYLARDNNWKTVKKGFDNGDTVFHLAAKRGHSPIFDVLHEITSSRVGMPTPDQMNRSNLLPFHYAAFGGHRRAFEKIKQLTTPEIVDKHPILFEAVRFGQHKCLKSLCKKKEYKSQIDSRNAAGETLLEIAAACANLKIVKLLLKYGAIPTEEEISAAVDGDDPYLMNLILDAKPKNRDILRPKEQAPLMNKACSIGTPEVVEVIMRKGGDTADVDQKSKETPFLAAAKGGNVPVSKYLQKRRSAVVLDKDVHLKTALHYSCEEIDVEMTKSLIVLGVDVNSQDKDGNTPLITSAKLGEHELVDVILECKDTDVNIKNYANESALSIAVEKGNSMVTRRLVDSGADTANLETEVEKLLKSVPSGGPEENGHKSNVVNENCCEMCGQEATSGFIKTTAGLKIHQKCLKCASCGKPALERIVIKDKKIYHANCNSKEKNSDLKCMGCNRLMERSAEVVIVKGDYYHRSCFCCALCRKQIHEGFVEAEDGSRLHAECNEEYQKQLIQQEAPVAIDTADRFSRSSQSSRSSRTSKSNSRFNTKNTSVMGYHVKPANQSDSPSPEGDLKEEILAICGACGKSMKGWMVTFGEKKFHKECFRCIKCRHPLSSKFFLVKDKPHCENCV